MPPTNSSKLILVTGATGKVGRHFVDRVLRSPAHPEVRVRALCHKRALEPQPRLEVVQGSIQSGVLQFG